MKTFGLILIAAASSFALAAHAACELPLPTGVRVLPDGATATQEQLVAARTEITAYVQVADTYIACIDEELAAAGEEVSPEFKAILVNRRNAAQLEKETLAAAFNRALQAFRAAHPGASQAGSGSSSAAEPRAESQGQPR